MSKPWPWQLPPSEASMKRAQRRRQGRANARAGNTAQSAVATRLAELGLKRVERRETGWSVHRVQGQIVGAHPLAKVSGDFTAVAPGGIYVHIESKYTSDPKGKLSLSDFQKDGTGDTNQIQALEDYLALGCWSLVAWSTPHGLSVMWWPIPGLAPGHPVSWERALQLNIEPITTPRKHA